MVLLYVKDIAEEDAKQIKIAYGSTIAVQKILDSSPLFSKKLNYIDKKIQKKYSLPEDFIYSRLPPLVLTRPYSKIENKGFGYKITNSATKHPILKDLFFQAQVYTKSSGRTRFSFQIGESRGFSNGPNEFYIHEKYTYLSPIILYFSDKRELYKNVYTLLLEKKEKFVEIGGEDFANTFLSLFSVEEPTKEPKNFVLGEKYLKQKIIFSGYAKDILDESFKLCSFNGISFKDELEGQEIENVSLYLNKKNQLGIYLTLDEKILANKMPVITSENINKLIDDPLYKKIIEDNLQDWLKDIIRTSNFATAIYNKFSLQDLQERL